MGRRPVNKKKPRPRPAPATNTQSNHHSLSLFEILADRRTGGAESIKGFVFQCRYSVWKMLSYFSSVDQKEDKFIRLEGIEDLDLGKVLLNTENSAEFIQIKASANKMDAARLWEKQVLQNFVEVYLANPGSRFRVVCSTPLAEGYLSRLAHTSRERGVLSVSDLRYWQIKFDTLRLQNSTIDWSSFDLGDFLSRITFEIVDESFLILDTQRLLIANYGISTGNESQYLNALSWNALLWSRDRTTIRHINVVQLIEAIKTEIGKGPANMAVKDRWITQVSFDHKNGNDLVSYFEGKAARPYHIAAGLPAKREKWEDSLLKAFNSFDVAVIKASSGQGKSTLAWQLSLKLFNQGWSVYELHHCKIQSGIGDIIAFLESRVRIGELPIIVIDGLRDSVSDWAQLAEQSRELPVKFLITTREEDWYRFGADYSKLRLIPITIQMDRTEAESIFYQFRQANQIHLNISGWQSAWEKVEERGLLIEYIYLLTQGEMIEERLAHQIRLLADEKSSAAKLEILRLVSAADICGVQLPSIPLINSVQSRVSFTSDRGEVLKSLKDEYFIQMEDRVFVEGLHPVRSEHLTRLLHETFPLVDTLINLVPLISNASLAQFSSQAPLILFWEQRQSLLESLASYASTKSYVEMNQIIDGLFATEVINHWKINKPIYDEMFERGVFLFTISAFPWSAINPLQDFFDAVGDRFRAGLLAVSELIKQIVPFNPPESDTLAFVKMLSKHLKSSVFNSDLSGLGRLVKWFIRFEQECPPFNALDKATVWEAFKTLESGDAGELYTALYNLRADLYESVIKEYKSQIIGALKRRTNTLTICEDGERLQIEYILFDYDQIPAHEQSISRIDTIKRFLPQYGVYCTQGLWPPIPSLEYYRTICDDSFKQIPARNLFDDFQINLNRIWLDRLSSIYACSSVYEWQNQWHTIRTVSLSLAKAIVRFFESILRGDEGRRKSSSETIDKIRPEIRRLLLTKKDFPQKASGNKDQLRFKDKLSALTNWTLSWNNFIDQLEHLIIPPEPNSKHIANVNIQETRCKLKSMQDAYDFVSQETYPYFDINDLKSQERAWYDRLSATIAFYISELSSIGNTPFPHEATTNWWARKEKDRIEKIHQILMDYEKESGYECIVPTNTIEDGIVREAIIGIRGLQGKDMDNEFVRLLFRLSYISDIDIHRFLIVLVKDNHPERPYAISVGNDYLEAIKNMRESGKDFEEPSYSKPHLASIESYMLDVLPGISLTTYEDDKIATATTEILVSLWKLSEARRRLSRDDKTEQAFLKELEHRYVNNTINNLTVLQKEDAVNLHQEYSSIVDRYLYSAQLLTPEEFQHLYDESASENQKG
jgi:hypothetical protein